MLYLAPKWRHGRKIHKFKNFNFFKFSIRPIENSIQEESSTRLNDSSSTYTQTLDYALPNALSIISARQAEQTESASKVAHDIAKSRKSKF